MQPRQVLASTQQGLAKMALPPYTASTRKDEMIHGYSHSFPAPDGEQNATGRLNTWHSRGWPLPAAIAWTCRASIPYDAMAAPPA